MGQFFKVRLGEIAGRNSLTNEKPCNKIALMVNSKYLFKILEYGIDIS